VQTKVTFCFRKTEVVSPFKRKRFNRTRISDTDDENQGNDDGTGDRVNEESDGDTDLSSIENESVISTAERRCDDSDYTSDSFICDSENSDQIDTDEEERLNEFR